MFERLAVSFAGNLGGAVGAVDFDYRIPKATTPFAPLSSVGLGDSLSGACGCTGYVDLYGKAAESALGTVVNVTNLATNDGRGVKPTALRVLTYPNMFVGTLTSPQPPFLGDTAFQDFYAGQLDALNAVICRDAEAGGAACVDLVAAFNGPRGDVAANGLIGSDNKHPTAAGHELIAKTLDAAGYKPLA